MPQNSFRIATGVGAPGAAPNGRDFGCNFYALDSLMTGRV